MTLDQVMNVDRKYFLKIFCMIWSAQFNNSNPNYDEFATFLLFRGEHQKY